MTHYLLGAPWRSAPPDEAMAWHCDAPLRAVSWKEFHLRIGAWQARLDTLAVAGQCWSLLHRDPIEFAAALIAAWERGDSIILPADDRPETLAELDGLTQARLGDIDEGHLAGQSRSPRWGPLAPDCIAVSLYTSGSTGEAKRLDKTFAQLEAELAIHANLWPLESHLVISQVSHQHIYGLLFAILRPLCEQAPMAGRTCKYPETLCDWLQRLAQARAEDRSAPHGAVLISAPPPLERLPAELDWQAADDQLKRVHSSGAPLSALASAHARHVLGVGILEIYGSSETGGIAWRDQQQGDRWLPLPTIEVSSDAHGCLWIRSPLLATRDWEPQADLIELDESGFRLLGRADRIAKVGGKRLSLTGLDRALEAHPDILEARTVALPGRDNRLGAILRLAPQNIPQDHASRRERIRNLRSNLLKAYEPTVIPRYWRFVDAWPTNAQGKLSQDIIKRLFRDLDERREPRWLGVEYRDEHACRITLEVPEKLVYLQGHFAQQPVVPGVVIIQWAVSLAREFLTLTGSVQRLDRVKFPRLLRPGERVCLLLQHANDARGEHLVFELTGPQGCHASGRMRLAAMEDPDAE